MIGKIISHYRVLEKLGEGGMGEVYLAHDEQLDRDVALKVLPAKTLSSESARQRLRKEALSLAKLNHPNIAMVHEFSTEDGVDFLVTEYIPGITLDTKLAEGALPESDVSRFGAQLAEGLEAAHAQGVIHRDLKPANLRLTPTGRLKILDFGIAQLAQSDRPPDLTASLTHPQEITGTLPYMAPEQLRGEKADVRSDIWAVGVVLYEMATGCRPFAQTTAPVLISAILNEAPQPPTTINRQVSSRLQSVIVKALAKDPARRYQSARELRADLERVATGAAPVAVIQRRWAWVAAVVGIVVLLVGGFFVHHFVIWRGASPQSLGPLVRARRSVAVLGFKNLSDRTDVRWLSTALSEMLTTELAAGGQLRTVPGENVARMKIDLSIPDADSYSPDTLGRIHGILNANYVVLGSYLDLGEAAGGSVRLDLRLQDAEAGETVALLSVKGTETQLDDLVSRAGTDLRRKLGVQEVAASEASTVRAVLPSRPEASRLYSEGLAKLRLFDAQAATDLLQQAIAAEPSYPLAHSALAAAWTALGYDERAKQEAKKAFDLSTNLAREERLSVEARYRATTNEWDKAVEIYRTLFSFFPDNLDYGLHLARAQSSAGKSKDALATIELLRKFPPPQGNDPRLDLAEAEAARSLGDFRRIEASADRAAVKGQTQGSQLVVARALNDQCVALRQFGEPKKAARACEQARRIYTATGDRRGVAMVLTSLANNLYEQGDPAGAKKMYEETLAIYRQIGNKRGAAGALDNLANVLSDLGDPAAARKLSEEALKIYREIGNYTGMGETLNNIAEELMLAGDFEGATKAFQQALDILRQIGDRNGVATTLNNLGDMLLDQGDLPQARSRYEEALSSFRDTGQKSKLAYPLFGLAEVLSAQGDLASAKHTYEEVLTICGETGDKHESAYALFGLGWALARQGDLAAARQRHEEALNIRKEIGEKATEAESLLALAQLVFDEGRPADAETLARKALDEFRTEKLRDDEVLAHSVLARSLLAQSRVADAQREIDLAAKPALMSPRRTVHLTYVITTALVRAATGATPEAIKTLNAIVAEATTYGYLSYQLEARLALGEIEMKSGRTVAGHSRLAALEKDATAKGFLLIARKAVQFRG